MAGSNRTIEEKLAIVQQLKSNNADAIPLVSTKLSRNTTEETKEEHSFYPVFLIIRLAVCVLLFGLFAWFSAANPMIKEVAHALICTEENGNLIDFMSPFTYTLQEDVESTSEE